MKNSRIIEKARQLYDENQFGRFSYGDKRIRFYPLFKKCIGSLEKNLNIKNAAIYDIGCGNGFWFDYYLKNGIIKQNIHGVDLANSNVSALKEMGYDVQQGDNSALNIDSNVSDLTISMGVIHHTPDSFKSFSELVRITKPGGIIFLSVYNLFNPYFFFVHKMTMPIRLIYLNYTKKIYYFAFPPFFIFYQIMCFLLTSEFVKYKSFKTQFMDQVITPRAELFTRRKVVQYCKQGNVKILENSYEDLYLMISFILKKES
jgi:SAM-dependent methyltransferase